MKWYGSDVVSDHRDDGDSSYYTTPASHHHQSRHHHPAQDSLMNRTESVGGETAQTNETEPLLGEMLLLSGADEPADSNRRGGGGGVDC